MFSGMFFSVRFTINITLRHYRSTTQVPLMEVFIGPVLPSAWYTTGITLCASSLQEIKRSTFHYL